MKTITTDPVSLFDAGTGTSNAIEPQGQLVRIKLLHFSIVKDVNQKGVLERFGVEV
jgi:hypothetical protein